MREKWGICLPRCVPTPLDVIDELARGRRREGRKEEKRKRRRKRERGRREPNRAQIVSK